METTVETTVELKSVTLWQSYVGRGAPSNAAGARTGLGWTKAQASAHAAHWANQAPYERFRRVTLSDQAGPRSLTAPEEDLAWRELGWVQDVPEPGPAERLALAHLRAGRYASAWLALHPVTEAR